ncbi:HipA N-terminal domain-containing protein [Sharpea porci]|jgi:serine/threonine-protein kinase HipA|uniref:HipA N-terminal domain-containing protein n=1 Tax=Sharpea porci TaxID=2652286 RepID=UPI002A910E73|nr:HipA N-terminal domain-containing protein [Sharpea porci]MDY5279019.1 HipA N-terminal domain-containing protein [Sharpea porci]
MSSVNRTAYIYVQDHFAGLLKDTDDGYLFQYDENYLQSTNPLPVSLTLPLSHEHYLSKTLFAFFDGLIPEGWLLDTVVKNWKIDRKDRFGLLLVSCRDCIGDVRIESEMI